MHIFLHEVRKIFRAGPMLAAAVVLLLLGQTTFSYYLTTLPVQSESRCALEIYRDWREQYGTTLDPDELPGLQAQLEALYAEADETIARWDETRWAHWDSFAEAGVNNYAEYLALLEKPDKTDRENSTAALLLDSRTDFLHTRINLVKNVLEHYDFESRAALEESQAAGDSPGEIRRCREIAERPETVHSILYSNSLYAAFEFAQQLALVLLLIVPILISPCLVRERHCRMEQLQWTTRTGRETAKYQLAAVLSVSAVLSLLMTGVFGVWFCIRWHAGTFWDCMAYSVGGSMIPWMDFTYGQYLLLLGGVLAALGTACGAAAFFLSRFSEHYVAMLLKGIPACAAFLFLANAILSKMLFFGNRFTHFTGLPGTELLVAALLLLLSLVLAAFAVCRCRRSEGV